MNGCRPGGYARLLVALVMAASCQLVEAEDASGFFVTRDGYFVTHHRAVAGGGAVTIRDRAGRVHAAAIIAIDAANDLALIKAEGSFTAIPIARSNAVRAGERVYAPTCAQDAAAAPTTALAEVVVTGLTGHDDAANLFRLAVSVVAEQPCGPLLSAAGTVVGVLAAQPAPTDAAYAVKSDYLLALLEAQPSAWTLLLPLDAPRPGTDAIGPAIGFVTVGASGAPASARPVATAAGAGKDAAAPEGSAAQLYESGSRALSQSDYASAHRALLAAAQQGHAMAQAALAGMYLRGQGVAQNDGEALKWYAEAARQEDPGAQAGLGFMYAQGRGVARDDAAAAQWFRLAAEQGDTTAQSDLGVMYLEGRGVDGDQAEAANWFRRAALQGELQAQNNLGLLFRDGAGVEQDEIEAAWWFRRAAESGNAEAQTNLGLMYAEGRGVHQDEAEALQWLRKAAASGDALAQSSLAAMTARDVAGPQDAEQPNQ